MSLDLREFIKYLGEKGELIDIDKPVSVEHEISAYVRKSCDTNGPAFVFRSVKEFPETKIVAGLYGSKRRMGLAIGFAQRKELSTKEALFKYIECMSYGDFQHTHETNETAPCKEVINLHPNLYDVPIAKHCELDSGFFITSGIQVVQNTYDSPGKHELGIHRMKVLQDNKLGLLIPWPRKIGIEYIKNSERGLETPISIFFGGDPIYALASQAKVHQKYHFAGELAGESLPLVKSELSDILVPANCEVVLEGVILPNSFVEDSPFGEYTSCYSFKSNAAVVKIKAITHRKDYIMPIYVTGRAPNEDCYLCGPAVASHIYKDLQSLGSDIVDVSCYLGNGVFTSAISIKKRTNEEVQNILHRMAASNYIKIGYVIDDDLNPNLEEDLRFAMETRFRPSEDCFMTKVMTGASLDPSYDKNNVTGKMLFDLTIPIGEKNRQKHTRVKVPGEESVEW